MLYEHIRISLSVIYPTINSCHITYLHHVDVFVCWLESNLGRFFCEADTLPRGYRVLVKVEFLWVLDDNSDLD